jgi:hypothetical protein
VIAKVIERPMNLLFLGLFFCGYFLETKNTWDHQLAFLEQVQDATCRYAFWLSSCCDTTSPMSRIGSGRGDAEGYQAREEGMVALSAAFSRRAARSPTEKKCIYYTLF